jgi:hypothetical protein
MKDSTMTLDQIRRAGLQALARELGPVGMVRFLQQFEMGTGNYTQDRLKWLGKPDVKSLAGKIRKQRRK